MGTGNGAMGEAVSKALDKWITENESSKEDWLKIAEEGLELGEVEFNRDELHEG